MNAQRDTTRVPEHLIAEAGIWIARLHGPNRDEHTDTAFKLWLQTSPEHTRAFEVTSNVWEDAQLLSRVAYKRKVVSRRPTRWGWAVAAACACLAVVAGIVFFKTSTVVTGIGEQRLLTMEDGTRVFLNTDTRISQHYDESARRIELLSGEALFEVAKRPGWPFLVTAGSRQIKALGTAFVVRYEPQQQHTSVTLVEGKVAVSAVSTQSIEREHGASSAPPHEKKPPTPITLTAGERLTFASKRETPVMDRPSIQNAVAWRRGQVSLDDMSFADAAAEMNRYNARRLVIEDPQTAALRVNGLFQAGDSESFAHAIADTYGLGVLEEHDRIFITGAPRPH